MATAPLTGSPSLTGGAVSIPAGPYSNQLLYTCPPNSIAIVQILSIKTPTNTSTISIYGQGQYADTSTYVGFSVSQTQTAGNPVVVFNGGYGRNATQTFLDNTTNFYAQPYVGTYYLYPGETLRWDATITGATSFFNWAVYQLSGS